MKVILILILIFLPSAIIVAEDPFWIYLNYPFGGPVRDFAIDKNDNLFAACQNGLFRSTNHGKSWKQIRKDNIKQVEIDSNDTIYALPINKGSGYVTDVIKSADGGESWDTLKSVWNWLNNKQLNSNFFEKDILKISIDKSNKIYLCLKFIGSFEEDFKPTLWWHITKIMYSDDYGSLWRNCSEYDVYKGDTAKISLVSVHNHGILTSIREINGIQYFSISKDNGASWNDYRFTDFYRNDLIDAYFLSDSIIYVLSYKTLFYTTDLGASWQEIKTPPSIYINQNSLIIFEDLSNWWLIHVTGILKTNDNGKSWTHINDLNYHRFSSDNKPLLTKDLLGNFYLTGSWGILKSTDSCKNFFKSMNGFVNYQAGQLRGTFDSQGNMYFGYNGIHKSSDKGNSWDIIGLNDIRVDNVTCLKDGSILAVNFLLSYDINYNEIYRSTDNGTEWNLWSVIDFHVGRIVQDNIGYLYAIPYRGYVHRSTDNGKSWEFLENSTSVGAITINSEDKIFIADYRSILNSSDRGYIWNKSFDLRDLPHDSVDKYCMPLNMWCGIFHPKKPVGFFHGDCDFKSIDNGKNWELVKEYSKSRDSLDGYYRPSYWYYGMAIDSLYNTWGGYYRSTDFGETWFPVTSGLDPHHLTINDMLISPDGYIFIATDNGGLYRSRDRYVSVPEAQDPPGSKDRLSASPNPASDYIEISGISPPAMGWGEDRIRIYNALGECVLSVETQCINYVETQCIASLQRIDISPLPPGLYFVRIGEIVFKFVKL